MYLLHCAVVATHTYQSVRGSRQTNAEPVNKLALISSSSCPALACSPGQAGQLLEEISGSLLTELVNFFLKTA